MAAQHQGNGAKGAGRAGEWTAGRSRFLSALALVAASLAGACAPRVNQISARNPDLFEKESDQLQGYSRGGEGRPAPDMYVKERHPVIRDAKRVNETGSLYSPDDERNYLFAPSGPHNVGRFLSINVIANRAGVAKTGSTTKTAASGADEAQSEEAAKREADQTEQELLKALPDLAPKSPGEPALLRSFKMQIVHRYDNGDVLARMTRRSINEDEAADITSEARIPYDRLAAGDDLTTDDLLDVKFVESKAGELVDRTSSGWEDEYSLRLSGFSEAKSKMAAELADQKKQLDEAKTKLETKIKTFGDERKLVAKQREDLTKKSVESEAKVKDLQGKVEDQQGTIEDQQKKIEELSPEEKPGDDKEGASGG